jgi:hypothetical protein
VKWRTVSENTIESDAGYKVLRCTREGIPTGRFIAFIERYKVLGGYDSREEAQQACDLHLYQTQQAVA